MKTRKRTAEPVTFETAREIALALPGVEEGPCYGTPAFRVRGKFLARLKEDGETLVVKIDFDTRDILLEADPETYYTTPHYAGHPSILVRLPKVDRHDLAKLLEDSWRQAAPKRLIAEYDRAGISS
jgi:hypothetical protein